MNKQKVEEIDVYPLHLIIYVALLGLWCKVHVIHDNADMLVWIALVCLIHHIASEYLCVSAGQLVCQIENHIQIINLYSPTLRFMLRVGDAAHRLMLIKFSVLVDGLDGMIDGGFW